jgi:hypothetical protein
MTAVQLDPAPSRRAVVARRIRCLAAAAISYKVIEAVAALWAGGVADSPALLGFGPDSVVEVASALALSWQFSAADPERREHLTLRPYARASTPGAATSAATCRTPRLYLRNPRPVRAAPGAGTTTPLPPAEPLVRGLLWQCGVPALGTDALKFDAV